MLTIKTKKAVNSLIDNIKDCVKKEKELTATFRNDTNVYEDVIHGMADTVYVLLGMKGTPFRRYGDCTAFKLVLEGCLGIESMGAYQAEFDAISRSYRDKDIDFDGLCEKQNELDEKYGVDRELYIKQNLAEYMG